jgi:hypothetical protein
MDAEVVVGCGDVGARTKLPPNVVFCSRVQTPLYLKQTSALQAVDNLPLNTSH